MDRLTELGPDGHYKIKRFTELRPAHWQACNRLAAYEDIGTVEAFRMLHEEWINKLEGEMGLLNIASGALKDAEQKRQETWHNTETPPDQDGLYWGKKDNTNSMWAVRYKSGVWGLSAYPQTKMRITEWAYWDAFEGGEGHDG